MPQKSKKSLFSMMKLPFFSLQHKRRILAPEDGAASPREKEEVGVKKKTLFLAKSGRHAAVTMPQ